MKYYAAKFAREKKQKPADWIIKPVTRGFVLVYIGGIKKCSINGGLSHS